MEKKATSSAMIEMLNRLRSFSAAGLREFEIVMFPQDTILEKPVDEWPLCEVLIAFFSAGFPLKKAQEYAALRRPLVFNDLQKQEVLFDRLEVYRTLEAYGVPVPNYAVFNADAATPPAVEDEEDYLQIGSARIQKPLVEKPISGEDHNIYIYYARAHGGGSKRLFRKQADRSSQYYPDVHHTRVHDGNSYIYEELLQTEGTDVKVYAVGTEYAHAEARKSPVVDGKVMRNARGREVRYPVILTADEKEIARKVVLAFGQTMCGFDLLRSNGRSYVCDVNGWSFVKDSHKFWDDSANLFRQYCLQSLAPQHLALNPQPSSQLVRSPPAAASSCSTDQLQALAKPTSFSLPVGVEDSRAEEGGGPEEEGELLCVVAFTRHGDRTPKQKLKFITHEPSLLALVVEHSKTPRQELRIKNVRLMEELLLRVEAVLRRMHGCADVGSEDDSADSFEKFLAVKQVLKSHPFNGINRKVQIKPTAWQTEAAAAMPTGVTTPRELPTEALFILKWGGELTQLGEAQSALLGTRFRATLYPGELTGVLRLHSTYRHDLKIYSSDEGRVQMTAAAFTKGFLDLEGRLPPILASLVSKNTSITKMLDETPEDGRAAMDVAKAIIHSVLTSEVDLSASPAPAPTDAPTDAPADAPADAPTNGGAATSAAGDGSACARKGGGEAAALARRPSSAPSSAAEVTASKVTRPVAGQDVGDRAAGVGAATGQGASNAVVRPATSKWQVPLALPSRMLEPSPQLAAGCSSSEGEAPTPTPAYATAQGRVRESTSRDHLPQPTKAVVSPFLDAISADADADRALLTPTNQRLSQLGHPKEALEQLLRLVIALTAELRERIILSGADGDTSPALLPTKSSLPATLLPMATATTTATATAAAAVAALAAGEGSSAFAASETRVETPANGETALLHYGRWAKLKREFFKPKKGLFDTTKIPDLYDNAMYDMLHNQHLRLAALPALYTTARALASYVVPQEYGAQAEDKVKIGTLIGSSMLEKLRLDLLHAVPGADDQEEERVHQLDHSVITDVRTPKRHVRTRLYFTSESHIHSLFNVLRWGSSADDGQPSIFSDAAHSIFHQIELSYLTHIVLRVLLRPQSDANAPASYCVQVLVSPGIQHHTTVCDAAVHAEQWQLGAHDDARAALFDALTSSQPLVLASSADLTLEEVDTFIKHVLEDTEYGQEYAQERPCSNGPEPPPTTTGRVSRASMSNLRMQPKDRSASSSDVETAPPSREVSVNDYMDMS